MKRIIFLILTSVTLAQAQLPDSLKQYFLRRDMTWQKPSATDTTHIFKWSIRGGAITKDSILFYDTTGVHWIQSPTHELTLVVTFPTGFTLTSNGNPILTDSARFVPGTNITSITQSGHAITINASASSTLPAPPDSAIQRDSANTFAADFHFIWERAHQAMSTKGVVNDPSGLPVVGGKVYTDYVIGSIANAGILHLTGNMMSEATGNSGSVHFGSGNPNTQNYYDDNGYTWNFNRDSSATVALPIQTIVADRASNSLMTQDNFFSTAGNFSLAPTHRSFRSYGTRGSPNVVTGSSPNWFIYSFGAQGSGFLFQEVASMNVFGDGTAYGSKYVFNTMRSGGTIDSTALALRGDGSNELGRVNPVIVSGYGGNVTAPGTVTSNKDTSQTVSNSFGPVQPYKVYVALLAQAGTSAPTPVILQNTLGGAITISRIGTGSYTFCFGSPFNNLKTATIFTLGANSVAQQSVASYTASSDCVLVNTFSGVGVAADIGSGGDSETCMLEIRVYP